MSKVSIVAIIALLLSGCGAWHPTFSCPKTASDHCLSIAAINAKSQENPAPKATFEVWYDGEGGR